MTLFILYAIFCLALILFWKQMPSFSKRPVATDGLKISVIIPVRNEAANLPFLLNALNVQDLDPELFEVIIVNDASTDGSDAIVENFIAESGIALQLIHSQVKGSFSPKKAALQLGIANAKNEIIVCTDGDCRPPKAWLSTIRSFFDQERPVFVSMPVAFFEGNSKNRLWQYFQEIEFASLIVSGAVSIDKGYPNMCSGANLAFLKSAFHEVDGYQGNEHLTSGDDEFLMHKMHLKFPGQVKYLKSKEVIVQTSATENLSQFFYQRKRWAGKWQFYQLSSPKILAFFIFMVNAFFLLFIWLRPDYLLIKIIPEFLYLWYINSFFYRKNLILYIPLLQVVYPFYVVFFALYSLFEKSFVWKGRKLN